MNDESVRDWHQGQWGTRGRTHEDRWAEHMEIEREKEGCLKRVLLMMVGGLTVLSMATGKRPST